MALMWQQALQLQKNVPSKALSVARARQVNKEDYVDQLLNKKKS